MKLVKLEARANPPWDLRDDGHEIFVNAVIVASVVAYNVKGYVTVWSHVRLLPGNTVTIGMHDCTEIWVKMPAAQLVQKLLGIEP